MGKKNRQQKAPQNNNQPTSASGTTSTSNSDHSDGPSEEELCVLQTSSTTLQSKLDLLAQHAIADDKAAFVSQFVPLDLSSEDKSAFLQDLTAASEAKGQWKNLVAEIVAIAAGRGVQKIEGDQESIATFFFEHPNFKGCDREVGFTCIGGEWRAEG
eukprot:CAMPEP_0197827660 /NCGR_PEP_ID=MMETSP1437-20131217/4395_1 /TAXON_ID=49252 ORGANISM="Eucampia antarctica, Strain CCMP1452" /NCGR_SAMPLE_ID=MMETSP1437 /ASSEMBLY_ACC=CAM_ASM_001096 /LENGTH=156 /DNA_ID=CAMNT_0043428597 /DNA_START=57 /DNA_END=530 /DNA_ORIENTATION=+